MASKNKYGAKLVYWDAIEQKVISGNSAETYRIDNRVRLPKHIYRFDSILEFSVYLELCRMYTPDRVIRQYPVEIVKPSHCYPNGRKWRVDFAICTQFQPGMITCLVEAKGAWLSSFSYTLALLEQSKPYDFVKLRIVVGGEFPKKSNIVKALMDSKLKDNLITFRQLEKLQQLP